MPEYNISQIQRMIDKLMKLGIKTEKAILEMPIEIVEQIGNYTINDVKTIIAIRKIAKENKGSLYLFLGKEEKTK